MASVKIDPVIGDKLSEKSYLLVYHLENGSCLIESMYDLKSAMEIIDGCKSGMSGVTKVTLFSKLEI